MNATATPEVPENPLAVGSPGTLAVPGLTPQKVMASPAFIPGVALLAAFGLLFWNLFLELPKVWFSGDGYYSHGVLIPFMSAYLIQQKWDRISKIPIRPAIAGLILLIPVLFLARAASVAQVQSVQSAALVAVILAGTVFVAGWRWMIAIVPAALYLLFGLPIWSMAINIYTNPLQIASTKVAFQMLGAAGFQPFMEGTTIHLNTYTLDVGVPCSGLKLVVALSAFTVFFMLVAKLKPWANLVLASLVLPLCLFINGLRIALIGVVGEQFGAKAGAAFHDWSGYLTLIVCFLILFKIVRLLGWKD